MTDDDITIEDQRDFALWLSQKEEEARETYREGTRSDAPRESDIALGKLRAFRAAHRMFLQNLYDE